MNPVFILSTPRSKGALLAKALGVVTVLEKALALPDEEAREQLAGGGWSNRIGKGGWEETVGVCSRLLRLFPGARLIRVTRDKDETERSIELTGPLWVPEFGSCGWKAYQKVLEMRQYHEDFAKLCPSSCIHVDAAEIIDSQALGKKLEIDPGRWQAAVAENATHWRAMKAFERDRYGIAVKPTSMSTMVVPLQPGQKRTKEYWESRRGKLANTVITMALPPKRGKQAGQAEAPGEGAPEVQYRLPIPWSTHFPRVEVHTIRFGEEPWLKECAPTLDAWCLRHGYPIRIWGQQPQYPADKFCEVDMLREFLKRDAEWMIYIDADVYVHPSAPVPDFMKSPGMHIMPDPPSKWVSGVWPGWLRTKLNADPGEWVYRNAGVWACDRAAAAKMLEVIREPYLEGQQEQHHWNYWLQHAEGRGMPVHDLARIWNRFPKMQGPAWFFHMAGPRKMKRLGRIRDAGYLPTRAEEVPELEQPDRPLVIAYPWRPTVTDELRYSLRSLRMHWQGDLPPVIILSEKAPGWLVPGCGVEWQHAPGYTDALLQGLHAAEEVVWMNDDIYLLKGLELEQLRVPIRYNDLWPQMHARIANGTRWGRHLGRCIRDLHHHGIDNTWNFSTHTPYLYKRSEAIETLRIFGYRFKIPFETLHFNRVGMLSKNGGGLRTTELPAPERARYLNHAGTPWPDLLERIQAMFPDPAPWEAV